MSTTSAEQFLLGGGGKSARFENVGDSITGTIASPPEVKQQTKMGTGEPLTWDNGDPKMQLVVTLQTSLREDSDDDGKRNVYVKGSKKPESQSLHAAVAAAVAASGAKGLDVGGTLTVTYIGNGVASTVGFNPPKKYSATYKAPDASDFLDTSQGQVDTTTGEIAQQPTAPAPQSGTAAPSAEQIAAVRAAGLDPATVLPGYVGG